MGTHLGQTGVRADCGPCEGSCSRAISRVCVPEFTLLDSGSDVGRLDRAGWIRRWVPPFGRLPVPVRVRRFPFTGSHSPVSIHLFPFTGSHCCGFVDGHAGFVPFAESDRQPEGDREKSWSLAVCCRGGENDSVREQGCGWIPRERLDRRPRRFWHEAKARSQAVRIPASPSALVSVEQTISRVLPGCTGDL